MKSILQLKKFKLNTGNHLLIRMIQLCCLWELKRCLCVHSIMYVWLITVHVCGKTAIRWIIHKSKCLLWYLILAAGVAQLWMWLTSIKQVKRYWKKWTVTLKNVTLTLHHSLFYEIWEFQPLCSRDHLIQFNQQDSFISLGYKLSLLSIMRPNSKPSSWKHENHLCAYRKLWI